MLAGLLQAFVLRAPPSACPSCSLAALGGLAAARWLGPRRQALAAGRRRVHAVCATLGWLLGGRGPRDPAGARAGEPRCGDRGQPWRLAGGVAFLRGMACAYPPLASRHLGRLLAIVVPGLVVAAFIGGTLHEPWRAAFMADGETQVVLFLGTVLPALALARVAEVSAGAVLDWRRNPGWLAMVGLLLGASAALAVWASAGAGPALSTVAWALAAPLLVAGAIWSVDRRGVQVLVSNLVAIGVVGLTVVALAGEPGATLRGILARLGLSGDQHAGNPVVAAVLAVIAALVVAAPLVVALAALAALVRSLLRLRGPGAPGVTEDETREIDRTTEPEGPRRSRRWRPFRRRPAPTDAVAAYQALLRDLDGHPLVARVEGETPAEHAGRLRSAGRGDLQLDLLAADYGLVRFGGAALSSAEHRRAIARAAALRRRLAARAPLRHHDRNTVPPG